MGIQERKERERQRRAQEILEAARRLFEAKGFLNTTLQDVAKEAEISVGLIYRYFESKEDIFASLALMGAEKYDREIEAILKKHGQSRQTTRQSQKSSDNPQRVLREIAVRFFDFYKPYGEYFDLLMYSFKGMKAVRVHGNTVTRLMSVTLTSLDRIKDYLLRTPAFGVQDEEEALKISFMLWGFLLGSYRVFDSSGRGHLFAFGEKDFVLQMVDYVLKGLLRNSEQIGPTVRTRPHPQKRMRPQTRLNQ